MHPVAVPAGARDRRLEGVGELRCALRWGKQIYGRRLFADHGRSSWDDRTELLEGTSVVEPVSAEASLDRERARVFRGLACNEPSDLEISDRAFCGASFAK